MALTFPSSPANGQIYTDSTTGNRYTYNTAINAWKYTSNTISMFVASTAPSGNTQGTLWWNQDYGRLMVWYNDGTSSQWVDASPFDATSALAYNTANAAYSKANSVFTGDVSLAGNVTPSVNSTFNLGSTTSRWKNIYTGDLHLSNDIGNWTIVEGEDDLFIYNNVKNKVYKFNLIEVDPSVVPPKKGA